MNLAWCLYGAQSWARALHLDALAVSAYDRDRLIRWLRDSDRWRLALHYDAVEAPPG